MIVVEVVVAVVESSVSIASSSSAWGDLWILTDDELR